MSTPFNPYWLNPGAAVPVNIETTAALVQEIQRLRAEAEKQQALDAMADNARELGLSYEKPDHIRDATKKVEQPAPSDMKQAIIVEASIQMTHPSKDARWFAKSVYEYLVAEQPAPAQPLTDEQRRRATFNICYTDSVLVTARNEAQGITKEGA